MTYRIEAYGKNGLYRYVFDMPATPINARPRKTKGGFKTKTEAKKAAKEFEREYILGLTDTNDDILYCDYLDFWLKKMKKDKSPSTIRNYDKVIRVHLKPRLGGYTLKALKRLVLEEFLKELVREGYKPNTVDNIKGVLTGSIRYAYLHDMVDGSVDNVISKLNFSVSPSRIKNKSHSTQQPNSFIPIENIQKLLERFPEGNTAHIPIMLGYHLGLRSGEAYGVRWKNIDFDNNTITIDGQVTYNDELKEWVYYPPKHNSVRKISMDDELKELLLREKARQDENKKAINMLMLKLTKTI